MPIFSGECCNLIVILSVPVCFINDIHNCRPKKSGVGTHHWNTADAEHLVLPLGKSDVKFGK